MEKRDYIYAVLRFFQEKNLEVSKILLQKAVYALDFSKIDMGLVFEGYIYGPFCREIGDVLNEMECDNLVEINGQSISINPDTIESQADLDLKFAERINSILSCFYDKVLEKEVKFGVVELNGTVMYVMDVLDLTEESPSQGVPSFDQVLEKVRLWKRDKFSESQIKETYRRILDSSWKLRQEAV